MKLVLAIINNDDSAIAASALTDRGFFVTKLSTTGGFLLVGNTTLLIGTEDNKIEEVKSVLKQFCITRKQKEVPTSSFGKGLHYNCSPGEVEVGGATLFVLNVDSYDKF